MDERDIRTTRTTEAGVDRDVDIRRTTIMGQDWDTATGTPRVLASAPINRVIHWGPIFAGLLTTLTMTVLVGALALGLGFKSQFGAFGGLTASGVGWGTVFVSLIAVFIGAYLTGYVSDLRTKAEGTLNGFMVGVMTIITPLFLGAMGAFSAGTAIAANQPGVAGTVSPSTEAQVRNALVIAADNAWTVFLGGVLLLAVAALAGYLGAKSREKAVETMVKHDLERRRAVV